MEEFASMLGCKIGKSPTSNPGLPLGASFKFSRVWDEVEDKFRKILAMWKKQCLCKGGRLTLIKSTLSSLPIYFISLFVISNKVNSRLEKIQRDLLWGGGALKIRPH